MRGILTIAHGQERYIKMAIHMVKSLKLTNPNTKCAVVTDQINHVQLKKHFNYVIPLREELGKGLIHKFYLLDYSPFDETMFIDSDCLVVNSLEGLWSMCAQHSFVATGHAVTNGEWYMDIPSMIQKFQLSSIPKFNGGFYYLKKDKLAKNIYDSAKELIKNYDKHGFVRFRGGYNEEPVIGVAMALNKVNAVDDQGKGMYTPLDIESDFVVDILSQKCEFIKRGQLVNPTIIHFCGTLANQFHYKREVAKLKLYKLKGSGFLIKSVVNLLYNSYYASLVFSKRIGKIMLRRRKQSLYPILPLYSSQ